MHKSENNGEAFTIYVDSESLYHFNDQTPLIFKV